MRTVLMTLSAMNVMFGVFVAVLYFLTEAPPLMMLALAVGLLAQGGYTLWFLSRDARQEDVWPTNLLLVGETLALMVGLGGLVISVVNNVNPVGGDHEYGPMAVAGLIAAHAFVALFIHAVREDAPQT